MLLANRYELQEVLGQGGFGRTYLTLDRYRFNEPCVVKEFLPRYHGEYETQKSRELFVRESKILHQIDHPQIPKFFACFEEDNKLFLVQEYIKGKTYSALLRERQQQNQTFSAAEILRWLKSLLPVLSYIHERQIVHRDISLGNIMEHETNRLPMLIDFGIGRSAEAQHLSQGNSLAGIGENTQQSIVGKVGYAPYEQIWLGQSFPSSDLYALAVTAIVLLTGLNPQALVTQPALKEQWQLSISISDGLVNILNQMLQDIPAHRYQSAAAILEDLKQIDPHPQTTASPLLVIPPEPIAAPEPVLPPPPSITTRQLQMPSPSGVTPEFARQCEQVLIRYVGPIGKFLVQNTLAQQPTLAPADFVHLLSQNIPQADQSAAFRNQLR